MDNTAFSFEAYFAAVVSKDAAALSAFFSENAEVFWHNTKEAFTLDGFIRANCDYPGEWLGEVERCFRTGDTVIAAARVWAKDKPSLSFHCCSFITLKDEKIIRIDEYWGDDGEPPNRTRSAIDKNTVLCLYDTLSEYEDGHGSEQLLACEIESAASEVGPYASSGDRLAIIIKALLENDAVPDREKAVKVCEYLKTDYDLIRSELSGIDAFRSELEARIDAFFTERGYDPIEKGRYQKRDGSVIKGLILGISPFFYYDLPAIHSDIVCKRAKVRRGRVRVRSEEYGPTSKHGHGSVKRRVKVTDHPAEGFDIFGCYGIIPDDIFWDSGLKSRTVYLPDIVLSEEVDEEAEAVARDLDVPEWVNITHAFAANADEAFEALRPYLDGVCSMLDRKKPNDEFTRAYNATHGKTSKISAFAFILLFIFIGLVFGSIMGLCFFILDRLTGGEMLPVSYFVKMALQCGAAFALLSGAAVCIINLFEKRRMYF